MSERDLMAFTFIGFCCGVTATLLAQKVVASIRSSMESALGHRRNRR